MADNHANDDDDDNDNDDDDNVNDNAAPSHLDMTVLEDEESDDANESSDEFNFNDVMVCKKNLAGTFDQHAAHHPKAQSIVAQHVARFEQTIAGAGVPAVSTATAKPAQKLSVSLRIRPPYSAANTAGNPAISTVELHNSTTIRTIPPVDSQTAKSARGQSGGIKEFEFASIFGPTHSQQDVYQQLAAPMVQTLIQEEHPSSLLFTYGITNAGKTHTILGNLADPTQWGVLPRAMQDLCRVDGGHVKMSFLEIYNEQLLDLLSEEPPTTTMAMKKSLKISGNSVVTGLTKHDVPNVQAGLELVQRAKKQRHTSSNHLNAHSSRSHSICQLELQISTISTTATTDPVAASAAAAAASINDDTPTTTKTFWIVDLAGSERSKRTGMMHSQRQREATLINASLMKLMRCLVPEGDIVPFRESKLTHFFMHHLQNGGHTSMIVNINPAPADFDETQHVLSYAVAAKVVDMIQVDTNKKSNAAATHGLDGRLLHPFKRPASDMVDSKRDHRSKISKLVSKFSPKKAFQRMNPANNKRKMEDQDSTKSGRAKVETQHSENTATTNRPNVENNPEKQIQWLKTQLSIAQAETQVLKSEKENLEEELQEVESQVRMEAAEEMQAQLQAMRDEYNAMYAVRKTTTQPTPSLSTKKAQMDKAQEIMDGLVEKVEECEEEMKRMREEHVEALANQTEEHESVVTTLTSELEHLKREHLIAMTALTKTKDDEEEAWKERIEEMQEDGNKMEDAWKERLQELELELERVKDDKAQQERMWKERVRAVESELRRVEQDKSDLVERYERIIREDCDEEENLLPPIEVVGSSKTHKPRGRISKVAGDGIVVSRLPFGELANNTEELLLPKKPAALMENGVYKRPSGRAPAGRDWDERKGAWRLSMCG